MIKIKKEGGSDPRIAASLSVFLASPMSDGITGKLISAIWDNWEKFEQNKKDLENTDIFTLRRITGAERGLSWSDK